MRTYATEAGLTSSWASATYTIAPQVAAPTFSIPNGSTVSPGTALTISGPTGSTIHYTTDGMTPTSNSPGGASPLTITINSTEMVAAMATQAGFVDSPVAAAAYAAPGYGVSPINVTTIFAGSPASFSFWDAESGNWNSINDYLVLDIYPLQGNGWDNACNVEYQPVTKTVYLLLDDQTFAVSGAMGSPAVLSNSHCSVNLASGTASLIGNSLLVTVPVTFGENYTGSERVRLWAYPFWGQPISMGGLTIQVTQPSAPTFSPASGSYASGQTVTISSTFGSTIHYTTDGSTPSNSSTGYTSPATVSVSSSLTLKALASAYGAADSAVSSAVYKIGSGLPADLHLTNRQFTSGTIGFQATNSITADGAVGPFTVNGTANVTLTAGHYIILGPGFDAKAGTTGAKFDAKIDPNIH